VERKLLDTWREFQILKELEVQASLGKSFYLHQRMLHFMQNLTYYMLFEVIEPRWHAFDKAVVESCANIDDVVAAHGQLQDGILKECLLTNQGLLQILTKLMTTALLFSEQIKRFAEANDTAARRNVDTAPGAARRAQLDVRSRQVKSELGQEGYARMIQEFEANFDDLLGLFMAKLWSDAKIQYHSHLSALCTRLDFNGFLSARWGEFGAR